MAGLTDATTGITHCVKAETFNKRKNKISPQVLFIQSILLLLYAQKRWAKVI
jgi:hypothetical protein